MQPVSFASGLVPLLVLGAHQVLALTQALCSSQNTGSGFAQVTDPYMTNGLCKTTCQAQYAFAVVQYTTCWCSNYAPADTTSVGSCNAKCPGYGFEQCGDQQAGLFGYVALGKSPLGTKGAAATSSSSASTSSTPVPIAVSSIRTVHQVSVQTEHQPQVTVQQTVTASPSVVVSVLSLTPSAKSSVVPIPVPVAETSSTTSTKTSTTSKDTSVLPVSHRSTSLSQSAAFSSTWSPTPVVSIMTVTGQVKTLTITPTSPPAETALAPVSKKSGFFSHPGEVAGVFVVVGLAVLALAGFLIWLFLRRRRHADAIAVASVAGGDTPQRRPSRLSQMGLLRGSTRKRPETTVPNIQTTGWGPNNAVEKSPTDSAPMDVRSSYPRVVDQRLDPVALWNPLHDNGSHVSIRSLQDNQDYSRRMLRVANPDQ